MYGQKRALSPSVGESEKSPLLLPVSRGTLRFATPSRTRSGVAFYEMCSCGGARRRMT